jgi:hypothetical protein
MALQLGNEHGHASLALGIAPLQIGDRGNDAQVDLALNAAGNSANLVSENFKQLVTVAAVRAMI